MSSKIVYDAVPTSKPDPASESDNVEALMLAKRRGCCFWIPCLGSDPSSPDGSWERIRHDYKDPWWNRGWKKIREWSELVAGPKWKTFIRRFNKTAGKRSAPANFSYDPMSYSLNFDEGPGQSSYKDNDYPYRDFSCRYASIPVSTKTSMDLGKDAPSFT